MFNTQDEFINKVLVPFYRTYADQNIKIGIKKIGGQMLFASKSYLRQMNVVDDDTFENSGSWLNNELNVLQRKIENNISRTQLIHDAIYIDVRKDKHASFGTISPIFDHVGTCFGVEFRHRKCNSDIEKSKILEKHMNLFNHKGISLTNLTDVNLNEREETILTLLILKYTQQEIARAFNCSRSSIAKVISEQLCPKFAIEGHSAKILVEKAINHGYSQYLPHNLIMNKIANA